MGNNEVYYQMRLYYSKKFPVSGLDFQRIIENHKRIFTDYLKPLRNELIPDISNEWHFLGIYRQETGIYVDIRFKIHSDQISRCKSIMERFADKAMSENLIEKVEYDENFLKGYSTRYDTSQIKVILKSLHEFSDFLIENISSEKNQMFNNKAVSILKELDHLVLFNLLIPDTKYHLIEAGLWYG
jgi:hypothetical protein